MFASRTACGFALSYNTLVSIAHITALAFDRTLKAALPCWPAPCAILTRLLVERGKTLQTVGPSIQVSRQRNESEVTKQCSSRMSSRFFHLKKRVLQMLRTDQAAASPPSCLTRRRLSRCFHHHYPTVPLPSTPFHPTTSHQPLLLDPLPPSKISEHSITS